MVQDTKALMVQDTKALMVQDTKALKVQDTKALMVQDTEMLSLFLFAFAKWSGILLSYLNENEVVTVTVRLIYYEYFVFCRACCYRIYIVSLLTLV